MNTELATIHEQRPSVMDMIAQVANGTDVAALEKLVDLEFRIRDEQKTEALNKALAQLEPKLRTLPKSKSGAKTKADAQGKQKVKFYYTPYQDIDKMLRPALRECGLLLTFDSRVIDGKIFFVAKVQEVTKGGFREVMLPYAPDGNEQLNGPQKVASGVSYAQRYAVKMLFNLVTEDDEDDDGNFAGAITDSQVGKINRLISEIEGFDYAAFYDYLEAQTGVREIVLIPADKFEEVHARLQQKKERVKK